MIRGLDSSLIYRCLLPPEISLHHVINTDLLITYFSNYSQLLAMESDSDTSALTDLSSELSSVTSRSPSPAFGYPSPQSSQEHSSSVSGSQQGSRKRHSISDDALPAKKRKSLEARLRTTVHLNLSASAAPIDQTSQMDLLLRNLRKRRKIVVIAGAGISTSAGSKSSVKTRSLIESLTILQFLTFARLMAYSRH